MNQIGCLGDIIFAVNSDIVETASNATWSGSARYSEHRRHLGHALTEFTGLDPDKFSFDMTLMRELGVDVMKELVKIWTAEREGTPLPLVLGAKGYGKYRWVIRNHRVRMRNYDIAGNLSIATVSVNLLEYLKGG